MTTFRHDSTYRHTLTHKAKSALLRLKICLQSLQIWSLHIAPLSFVFVEKMYFVLAFDVQNMRKAFSYQSPCPSEK